MLQVFGGYVLGTVIDCSSYIADWFEFFRSEEWVKFIPTLTKTGYYEAHYLSTQSKLS